MPLTLKVGLFSVVLTFVVLFVFTFLFPACRHCFSFPAKPPLVFRMVAAYMIFYRGGKQQWKESIKDELKRECEEK